MSRRHRGRLKKRTMQVPGAPTVWEKNRRFLETNDLEEQFREMSRWVFPVFMFLDTWTGGLFKLYNLWLIWKTKKANKKKELEMAQFKKKNEEAFRKRQEEEKKKLAERGMILCKICETNDRTKGGIRVVRDPQSGKKVYVHEKCVREDLRKMEREAEEMGIDIEERLRMEREKKNEVKEQAQVEPPEVLAEKPEERRKEEAVA